MESLTDEEKKFVAIALAKVAIEGSIKVVEMAQSVAQKLDCTAELEIFLNESIRYMKATGRQLEKFNDE